MKNWICFKPVSQPEIVSFLYHIEYCRSFDFTIFINKSQVFFFIQFKSNWFKIIIQALVFFQNWLLCIDIFFLIFLPHPFNPYKKFHILKLCILYFMVISIIVYIYLIYLVNYIHSLLKTLQPSNCFLLHINLHPYKQPSLFFSHNSKPSPLNFWSHDQLMLEIMCFNSELHMERILSFKFSYSKFWNSFCYYIVSCLYMYFTTNLVLESIFFLQYQPW